MTEIIVQIGSMVLALGAFIGQTNYALGRVERRLDKIDTTLENGLQRIASLEATRKP